MRVTYKTKQLGVSLVEMMATISIMALILAGLANLSNRYLDEARAVSAGIHLRMISDAMNDYHRDKFAAITAVATDTVPAKIKVETLIADGYLPPTFNPVNEYGQTVCALTLEPTTNRLETLVVTEGGLALTDGELHSMIDPLGASAGALFTANPANPPGPTTHVIGVGGSYNFAPGDFHDEHRTCALPDTGNGGVNLTPGHAVMALWFDLSDYASGVLYRNAIAGRPELNTMNTDIDMNDNSILNLLAVAQGDLCASLGALAQDTTGEILSCQDGTGTGPPYSYEPLGDGSKFWEDRVPTFGDLPLCQAGNNGVTRVVLSSTVVGGGATSPRAYTCGGGAWRPLAMDVNGNIIIPGTAKIEKLDGNLQVTFEAVQGTDCTGDGRLARTTAGTSLSCVSGKWRSAQTRYEMMGTYSAIHGWSLRKPNCLTGGTDNARIIVTPQHIRVGAKTYRSAVYARTRVIGGTPYWQVMYPTWEGDDKGLTGVGGSVLVQTFCLNW